MNNKQVTVFGSSGLIGSFLLDFLIADTLIDKIIVVHRKPLQHDHPKFAVQHIDFLNPLEIEQAVENSDIVFSCIGTTQSRVEGDKAAYREVDYDITYGIAQACKAKNVACFVYVSSAGANSASTSFYMQLKGEIDDAVTALNLASTYIFRPSLLLGKRKEFRFGEKIAQFVMPLFAFLLPAKLKPIQAEKVAKAMINLSKSSQKGTHILENNSLI